jgi:hypothetical protein
MIYIPMRGKKELLTWQRHFALSHKVLLPTHIQTPQFDSSHACCLASNDSSTIKHTPSASLFIDFKNQSSSTNHLYQATIHD